MFTVDGIRKFHGWTHASLSLLLDHVGTLSPADYTREVPGFGRPTIRHELIHTFNCEGFWVHVLQGLRFQDRAANDYPDVSRARVLQQEVSVQTLAYLSRLSDEQLNSGMELRFADGDTAVRTPALVLHHLLTHAFHHKGQIVAMCRALGHPAPDTDLNQFQ